MRFRKAIPYIIATGDVLAFLLFVLIGQRDHDSYAGLPSLLLSTAIFTLPWWVLGWLMGAFPKADDIDVRSLLWQGLVTWLLTAPIACCCVPTPSTEP